MGRSSLATFGDAAWEAPKSHMHPLQRKLITVLWPSRPHLSHSGALFSLGASFCLSHTQACFVFGLLSNSFLYQSLKSQFCLSRGLWKEVPRQPSVCWGAVFHYQWQLGSCLQPAPDALTEGGTLFSWDPAVILCGLNLDLSVMCPVGLAPVRLQVVTRGTL